MKYDPIKDRLGALVSRHPALQRLLYDVLDLLLLRAWYVRRELKRLLSAYPLGREVRVLDAGTGFGQYAYFVARTYPNTRVHAVDLKEDYLERARRFVGQTQQAGQITFVVDDLTDLKAEGPFDLILSVDVMEHIEDDRAVFRHFARVLRPGGHVLINTPSDLGGSDVQEEGEESFIEEHVREGYNLNDLQEKLHEAGLEPIKSLYTYGPHGSLAWRLLIKHPLQLLNRSWALLPLVLLYYVPALPLGLYLNAKDLERRNERGTGLLVVAQRPA